MVPIDRQAPLHEPVSRHWILAGSIGLDTVAHRNRLRDTINDLRPLRLGPFDEETALAFLHALGEGEQVPISDEVAARIVERAGWPIPFHLQALFSELKDCHRESGEAPTPADADAAFDALLAQNKHFDSWHERLTDELGEPDATHARDVLSAAARDRTGATRATLRATLEQHVRDEAARDRQLQFLIDVLVNDGYLRDDGERFAFRSELLRAFWLRRYA